MAGLYVNVYMKGIANNCYGGIVCKTMYAENYKQICVGFCM